MRRCGHRILRSKLATDGSETAKNAKVFSPERFPLYGPAITINCHSIVGGKASSTQVGWYCASSMGAVYFCLLGGDVIVLILVL